MGIATVSSALKETLEKAFPNQVAEYGYHENSSELTWLVIRFGGLASDQITEYGPKRTRFWLMNVEVYSHMDDPSSCYQRLCQAVDKAMTVIERWPQLGKGSSSDLLSTEVIAVGSAEEISEEEGTVTGLTCTLVAQIEEEEEPAEQE
jgi:hypothetical protein